MLELSIFGFKYLDCCLKGLVCLASLLHLLLLILSIIFVFGFIVDESFVHTFGVHECPFS